MDRFLNIFRGEKSVSHDPYTWAFTDTQSGIGFFQDDLVTKNKRDLGDYYRSWNKVAIDIICTNISEIEFDK